MLANALREHIASTDRRKFVHRAPILPRRVLQHFTSWACVKFRYVMGSTVSDLMLLTENVITDRILASERLIAACSLYTLKVAIPRVCQLYTR